MRSLRLGRSVMKRGRLVLAALIAASGLALILPWTSAAPAGGSPTLTGMTIWNPPTTLGREAQPTIAGGDLYSLAICADGSLWAWGNNSYGELGDGTTINRSTALRIGTGTDWVAVSAGGPASLALKSDGSLWAWGRNEYGQLGDGTTTDRHVPTRIGAANDWVAVHVGGYFSLALKSNGSLWAWGSNAYGQLGDGTTTDRHVPTRIGTDTHWVRMAAGFGHVLALKSDGSLWAWGWNSAGKLGDGTTTDRLVPTRIGTGTDWVTVAAGYTHSMAIKSDSTLWAWGWNPAGELGDGTTSTRLVPTKIGRAGSNWSAISAGYGHSLALKSDGSLYAWGYNKHGELGDGTNTSRRLPTRIGTGTNGAAISAGKLHSLCLWNAGLLWSSGNNQNGELGDGTFIDKWSFVQVIITGIKIPGSTTITTNTTVPTTTTSSSTTTTSATTTTTLVAKVFTDVPPENPYYTAISAMADRNIISGYLDGTFGPEGPVLRAQFAKMIVGAMGLPVTEDDWQDSNPPFTDFGPDDLANLYPHDYIAVAKAHNLTAGVTATTFAPWARITRAQMVTMVVRAAQNSGIALNPVGADYAGPFEDYSDPTHGANVHLADYNGLLQGLQVSGAASTWMEGDATRGEAAQVLWNLMQVPAD
jgi:alpha-tubulin suppressor-like RCC1 family protein